MFPGNVYFILKSKNYYFFSLIDLFFFLFVPTFFLIACKILSSSETQNVSATALVLVMPVLQILSSSSVGDCLQEDDSGATRQQLAINLLGMLQEEGVKDRKEMVRLCGLGFVFCFVLVFGTDSRYM